MSKSFRIAFGALCAAAMLAAAAVLFLAVTAPKARAAEVACYPVEAIASAAAQLGQKPAFSFTLGTGLPATLLLASDGRFTVVIQPQPDMACLFAEGSGWQPAAAPAPQKFRPAPRSPRMRDAALQIRDPAHPGG